MTPEVVPGFTFPSRAHELWALLLLVATGPVESRSNQAAAGSGLSPVSAWALTQLEPGKPVSQKELAGRLHCSPSTVVDPTDRLEKRGLVVRQPDPADRRRNVLVVTEKGRRVRRELIGRWFAPPAPLRAMAPQDRARLRSTLLELLAANSTATDPDAGAGRRARRRA